MAKNKRSVYNFILGFTISGLIVTSLSLGGSVALNFLETKAQADVFNSEVKLFETIEECTGDSFRDQLYKELDKLEEDKLKNKIDRATYITHYGYLNSQFYKDEYIKENHADRFNNEIIPLREAIENKKQAITNAEDLSNILAVGAIASSSITSYSFAATLQMRDQLKREKEAEKQM